jgi:hypothetical protein
MKRLGLFLGAAALFASCSDPFSRFSEPQAGVLRRATTDSIDFATPDTVTLATNFEVSVTTYGGSCDVKGDTELFLATQDSAHFVPINVTETETGVCQNEDAGLIHTFIHSGTMQFSAAGPKTVTLFGRDADGANITRTRGVFVRQP